MRFVDVIRKKRDGEALSEEEIEAFVSAYTAGEIPDTLHRGSAFPESSARESAGGLIRGNFKSIEFGWMKKRAEDSY